MSEIAQAPSAPDALEGYDPGEEFYDEAFSAAGAPRPHYEGVLGALSRTDLQALSRAVTADASARGVTFGTSRGAEPFAIDPVPRLIAAREWKDLEAGLAQRVRALNAFIADVYADRGIFEAGLLPEGLLEGAVHLEPEMTGVTVPGDAYAVVAGLDLARAPDGRLLVLEDNLRTPSGLSYAVAAGEIVEERLPAAAPDAGQSLDHAYELLGAALRAAAPDGRGDPSIVLLSDGPQNSAWYEHKQIARHLGLPIVTLADLDHSDGRLFARTDRERRRVDVVYRRTDDERLRDEHGRLTAVAQALLEPMRRGRLTCVNAFGTGIADDKLTHAYSDRIVRFYLGEEPLLESATSYDLGQPEMLDAALERLDELVIKPRTGHGGKGVVVCARASPQARDEVASILRDHPADYVAQELVRLSRHPTVVDGRLEPRHVDLRPFALSAGKDVSLVPGGLTRVAFDSGELVVNSSRRGGGKATWVLG